jgi:hypothetical protein
LRNSGSQKKQHWNIALIAAVYGIAHTAGDLELRERVGLSVLSGFLAVGGCYLLLSLHSYIGTTRTRLDKEDKHAWLRGTPVLFALVSVILFSAVVVIYFLVFAYFLKAGS